MTTTPTSRSQLMRMGATLIASAMPPPIDPARGPHRWTELSLWWIDDENRPYIAVVEGHTSFEGEDEKFRAARFGAVSSAIAFFDPSDLREELLALLPEDLETVYPNANDLRSQRAADNRGFRGETIKEAIDWLYSDQPDLAPTQKAKLIEADFDIPWRTAYNAMDGRHASGWTKGFINALRYLNRGAWRAGREARRA